MYCNFGSGLGGWLVPSAPEDVREIGCRTERRIGVALSVQLDVDQKLSVRQRQTGEPHDFRKQRVAFVPSCDELLDHSDLEGGDVQPEQRIHAHNKVATAAHGNPLSPKSC